MRILTYTLFGAGIVLFAGLAYLAALQQLQNTLRDEAMDRGSLYRATVRAATERLAHLPEVTAIHPNTRRVLAEQYYLTKFSAELKAINDHADAAALYLMDRNGNTIAASNYLEQDSFVGRNYGFRPYFLEAIEGKSARYFAVGATTGRVGYFVSSPVITETGEISGVVVAKTEFDQMLSDWQMTGETVLISDENDVVILASRPEWMNQTVRDLSPEVRERLAASRQYGNIAQDRLTMLSDFEEGRSFTPKAGPHYLAATSNIKGLNWKLHYLSDRSGIENTAAAISAMAALLAGFLGLGVLFARSKQRQRLLEAEAKETDAIRTLNRELVKEVSVRKKAESQLLEMQDELVMNSRLAALGKMSAAIVHEINQPVSAVRNFAASGLLLLAKGDKGELENNLKQIKNMTNRLGEITSDLLIFSRRPLNKRENVDFEDTIRRIAREYQPEIDRKGIRLELNAADGSSMVTGKRARFEQLVSNLLRNAVQAVETIKGERLIRIDLSHDNGRLYFAVEDNGPGVEDSIRTQLFEPFFTTKDVGEGVGLGLAICFAIIEEAGGSIKAGNGALGGARFEVSIPMMKQIHNVTRKKHANA